MRTQAVTTTTLLSVERLADAQLGVWYLAQADMPGAAMLLRDLVDDARRAHQLLAQALQALERVGAYEEVDDRPQCQLCLVIKGHSWECVIGDAIAALRAASVQARPQGRLL